MMPSLYSGVSGLRNHATRMNVVSNNIANVNTYGFKYARVAFQDMLSMDLSGAASPTDAKGGVNPKQYGLGMTVASIDNIFTQGSLQSTGKTTDLAITGEGFFVMKKGDETFYTRAGDFDLDKDGTLVNPANGLKVQGWTATTDAQGNSRIDTSASISDVKVPVYSKLPARATTTVDFRSNLNLELPQLGPNATEDEIQKNSVVTTIDTYDSEGLVHPLKMTLWHTGENQWTARPTVTTKDPVTGVETNLDVKFGVNGQAANPVVPPAPGAAAPAAGIANTVLLNFDPQGSLVSVADSAGQNTLNTGKLSATLGFTVPGKNPQNLTLNLGTSGRYDGVTQMASVSTTKAYKQDGYGMGYLESFIVDDSGVVTGSYTNGQRKALGEVALSVFTNNGGLKKSGENLFTETNNSGLANIGVADTGGRGKINSGKLEMSNVDLAEQFTDMIVTERGFQANSKSITTSDQMLQELMNLKR